MKLARPTLTATLATLTAAMLALAPLPADAQGRHGGYRHGGGAYGHGYWGPGPFWGGVGLGLGIGLGSYYYGAPGYPVYPGYVLVEPPPVYYPVPAPPTPPAAAAAPTTAPAALTSTEPVIYPRNGQSPAQTEADRQACNRWATTQQAAMADASVFNRATAACMDGRGYTLR